MRKEAAVAVFFGTAGREARRTIQNLYQAFCARHMGEETRLCFTSSHAIKALRERGEPAFSFSETLKELQNGGFRSVSCRPFFLFPGAQFELVREESRKSLSRFDEVRLSRPLLCDREDAELAAPSLLSQPGAEGAGVLWISHNQKNRIGAASALLDEAIRSRDPLCRAADFDDADEAVSYYGGLGIKRILLRPFLLTAGYHSKKDIFGAENSVASSLRRAGFCVLEDPVPLGERQAVWRLFLDRPCERLEALLL